MVTVEQARSLEALLEKVDHLNAAYKTFHQTPSVTGSKALMWTLIKETGAEDLRNITDPIRLGTQTENVIAIELGKAISLVDDVFPELAQITRGWLTVEAIQAGNLDTANLIALIDRIGRLIGQLQSQASTITIRTETGADSVISPGDDGSKRNGEVKTIIANAKTPDRWALRAFNLACDGRKQVDVATIIQAERRLPTTQGQVSRWVSQVKGYLKARGISIEQFRAQPVTWDNATIDMGKRQDGKHPPKNNDNERE